MIHCVRMKDPKSDTIQLCETKINVYFTVALQEVQDWARLKSRQRTNRLTLDDGPGGKELVVNLCCNYCGGPVRTILSGL